VEPIISSRMLPRSGRQPPVSVRAPGRTYNSGCQRPLSQRGARPSQRAIGSSADRTASRGHTARVHRRPCLGDNNRKRIVLGPFERAPLGTAQIRSGFLQSSRDRWQLDHSLK
jgi:hypothetical protein